MVPGLPEWNKAERRNFLLRLFFAIVSVVFIRYDVKGEKQITVK